MRPPLRYSAPIRGEQVGDGRCLRRKEMMTIEVLHERGLSNQASARLRSVHEHPVRYRSGRRAGLAPDGCASKCVTAVPWADDR